MVFKTPKYKSRKRIIKKITVCRICGPNSTIKVDHKNIPQLQRFVTSQGKILSRKRLGTCAGCQNKVKRAVKRARFMAFLPFVQLY
ncbi:MAG: 30S ribosomal protein S18 [Candidatus Brocadiia bacterium]